MNQQQDKSHQSILAISYFVGLKGFSPAEWMDDKLDSLSKCGKTTILISALGSQKCQLPNTTHYRVPSISEIDIAGELSNVKIHNQKLPLVYKCLIHILKFIGKLSDLALLLISKGMGGGKHSWAITSFFCGLYCIARYQITTIFSSGGAASSHVSAIALGILTNKPVIIELQDPLSGHGIGRNSRSAKLLFGLEKILAKYAHKLVFVTKQAANEAREKHKTKNICYVYPGAKNFLTEDNYQNTPSISTKVRFLHLGTLYSSRNFNTLVQAFDELISEQKLDPNKFELINLGDIHGEYLNEYKKRTYFQQLPILPRSEAIAFARNSAVNLLVQHTDPRSSTTIPYKYYDYLNIRRPIFGLQNNTELKELLVSQGHFQANINDVSEIKAAILEIIATHPLANHKESHIDAITQCEQLFEL